ncbi:MAG TPA: glutamate formiminotransferase [Actinomycetota bacterium]|nr:glutamate formiminotransferase [Actinomycetota bacterium]
MPNVSEGRDRRLIERLAASVSGAGARVLDVHSDAVHNRTVITAAAEAPVLAAAMAALAREATAIDLTRHTGVHPRIGVLDVCPFVVDEAPVDEVVQVARSAGALVAETAGLPVYLYAHAATRSECAALPALRKGGLERLIERSETDLPPDFGVTPIDPRRGVVCVGARGVLVAFNVWLRAAPDVARRVAARVRAELGGAGVRTLGLDVGGGLTQVSMNVTEPDRAGVDDAYRAVAAGAAAEGAEVHATEIVGLPPERYMPDPDAEAARLLIEPGRSLELVLAGG